MKTSTIYHSCIFRSVAAGMEGKSRTSMQTGTRQPPIPPRVKFQGVSAISAGMRNPAGILFGFLISFLSSQTSFPSHQKPLLKQVVQMKY